MANHLINGAVPAIITPFDDNYELNTAALPKILAPLLEAGSAGIFVTGSTGEPTTMTMAERKAMVAATIAEVAGAVPVIAHVGGAGLDEAIEMAKHAQEHKADGISSVPPLVRGDLDADVSYYTAIGAATDLPFYVYWRGDMAHGSPVAASEFLAKMATVPNFIGIKFADTNFYFLQQISALSGGKINIITGPDEMHIAGLVMGSQGGVGTTYNVMPKQFVGIYEDFQAGRIREAMKKQAEANELIALLLEYGLISGTKALLNRRGIPAGPARKDNVIVPYTEITSTQLDHLQSVVDKYDLQ